MREQVKFWRSPHFLDLELLRARFVTHAFNRHIHDTFAIGVILAGAEEFFYRGEMHVATAGTLAIINPGEVHTGQGATPEGWTYRMLYPDARLLQDAASEVSDRPQPLPYFADAVIRDDYLTGLIVRLHLALEEGASLLEQESRLLWTLGQLVIRRGGDRPVSQAPGQELQAIQLVQRYVEEHYADSITLDNLAAIANLSPFYLLRTFRKQVGLPPHEYLNQVRFWKARQLLREGWAIADVAQKTGFADQSHLTRQFKRRVGVTPGVYQKGNFVQDERS